MTNTHTQPHICTDYGYTEIRPLSVDDEGPIAWAVYCYRYGSDLGRQTTFLAAHVSADGEMAAELCSRALARHFLTPETLRHAFQ